MKPASFITDELPFPPHEFMARVRGRYLSKKIDWLEAVETVRDEYSIHPGHLAVWNTKLWGAAWKNHEMTIWTVERKLGKKAVAKLMTQVEEELKKETA